MHSQKVNSHGSDQTRPKNYRKTMRLSQEPLGIATEARALKMASSSWRLLMISPARTWEIKKAQQMGVGRQQKICRFQLSSTFHSRNKYDNAWWMQVVLSITLF